LTNKGQTDDEERTGKPHTESLLYAGGLNSRWVNNTLSKKEGGGTTGKNKIEGVKKPLTGFLFLLRGTAIFPSKRGRNSGG